MDQQKKKFSLSLNFFDTMILLIVVAIAGVVLWYNLSEAAEKRSKSTHTMQYTILMNNMREGSGALVREGSEVHDVLKNYAIGTVVSADIQQASEQKLNQEEFQYQAAFMEGYEDVYVLMEAEVVDSGDELIIDGGYVIRVGQGVFLRGEGYMAAGTITDINRVPVG